MATAAQHAHAPVQEFGEKAFYLDEFRARTLCFAASLEECEQAGGFETLGRVLRELIGNDTRVIVFLGLPETRGDAATSLRRVRRRLQSLVLADETASRFPAVRGRQSLAESFIDLTRESRLGQSENDALERLWRVLRNRPLLVGVVDAPRLVDFAQRLAGRLRVHKLVIIEPQGGVSSESAGQLSFMDGAMLTAVLRAGQAEWVGLAARRKTLDAIQAALQGGVHAVNLCSLEGLPRELYTYEGAGTLFTLEDYCRVERLGIDDFQEIERLVARGHREGYLKARAPEETARILLNGFGATIGAHHFAGVCGLETEPYQADRAGEMVGLYTITRFKGEGVGTRLLARVFEEARTLHLHYVFACTLDERAQAFFERQGFRLVTPQDVPAAKWVGYDQKRRARLMVYRRDVEAPESHEPGPG